MYGKQLIIVLTIASLVGCETLPKDSSDDQSQPQAQLGDVRRANLKITNKVFLSSECIVGQDPEKVGFLLGIASGLLSSLIGAGFDLFADAVREAGKKDSKQQKAERKIQLFTYDQSLGSLKPNPNLACIIVVRGKFLKRKDDAVKLSGFWSSYKAPLDAIKIYLAEAPQSYAEFALTTSEDQTAFKLVAQSNYYEKHFSGWSDPSIVYNISFNSPASDGTNKTIAGGTISFGKISANKTLSVNEDVYNKIQSREIWKKHNLRKFEDIETGWIPMFAISPASKKAFEAQLNVISQRKEVAKKLKAIGTAQPVTEGDKKNLKRLQNALSNERTKYNEALIANTRDTKDGRNNILAAYRKVQKAELSVKNLEEKIRKNSDFQALQKRNEMLGKQSPEGGDLTNFMPITLQSVITETKDENKFLLFIADVLSGAKKDVVAAVGREIVPTLREEAKKAEEKERTDEETKEDSIATNLAAADVAYLKAIEALNKANNADSPPTADRLAVLQAEIDAAKILLNIARRKAGLPPI